MQACPLRSNTYRRRYFDRAVVEAGLNPTLTVHDLRDVTAAIAFGNGATVVEVQRMLGHKKPSITLDRYSGQLGSKTKETNDRLDRSLRELTAAATLNDASPPTKVLDLIVG